MVNILITAGPTREYLDDVRFLSNGSSGRMGCALAEAGLAQGHTVTIVLGPVEVAPPSGAIVHSVVSALQMQSAAESAFPRCDLLIAAAAVADWRPAVRCAGKPPRPAGPVTLELVPNPDIVAELSANKGSRVVIGFALESVAAGMEAAIERGRDKLQRKQMDGVVVNLHDTIGADRARLVLCFPDGRAEALPELDKRAAAARIVAAGVQLCRTRAS